MLQDANSMLVNLYTKRDRCWLSQNGWTRDITNKVKLRSQFEEMEGDNDDHNFITISS